MVGGTTRGAGLDMFERDKKRPNVKTSQKKTKGRFLKKGEGMGGRTRWVGGYAPEEGLYEKAGVLTGPTIAKEKLPSK